MYQDLDRTVQEDEILLETGTYKVSKNANYWIVLGIG